MSKAIPKTEAVKHVTAHGIANVKELNQALVDHGFATEVVEASEIESGLVVSLRDRLAAQKQPDAEQAALAPAQQPTDLATIDTADIEHDLESIGWEVDVAIAHEKGRQRADREQALGQVEHMGYLSRKQEIAQGDADRLRQHQQRASQFNTATALKLLSQGDSDPLEVLREGLKNTRAKLQEVCVEATPVEA